MEKRLRNHYLSMYRRHAGGCTQKKSDLNCDCPVWAQGRLHGQYIRTSLNTRSLASAEQRIRTLLNPDPDGPRGPQGLPTAGSGVSLENAKAGFLAAKKDRTNNTVDLYTSATTHFIRYAEVHRVTELRDVTPDLIQRYFTEFAGNWKSVRTKRSRLTHLRVFFTFCKDMNWVRESPAATKQLSFRAPVEHARAPFSPAEISRILMAVDEMPAQDRDTARALILLLLYSGMRISDATFLQRRSILPANVLDYVSIKTHRRIELPMELHQAAIDALAKVPGGGQDFFFVPEGDYRRAIAALNAGGHFADNLPAKLYMKSTGRTTRLVGKVLEIAKVDGMCHRFRDTYAVNMLAHGVSMDILSLALGHSDVRITRDHYLNLVPGYRERLSQASRVLNFERLVS